MVDDIKDKRPLNVWSEILKSPSKRSRNKKNLKPVSSISPSSILEITPRPKYQTGDWIN